MFIYARQGVQGFKTNNAGGHCLRTTLNFTAFICYYYSITQLALADASAIVMATPLFLTALSGPLLGEPVGIRRHLMLFVGFIGVLIIVQPTGANLNGLGSLSALVGAIMFALLGIQSRKMIRTESAQLMIFYPALLILTITAVPMMLYWETTSLISFVLMLLLGVLTLFAQYALVQAYKYARVHVIAPFQYCTVIMAVFFGWFLFSENPTLTMLGGTSLIVGAGIAIVWYEHLEKKRSTRLPIAPGS